MVDSEKVTINLTVVDLGKIDLLVAEGIYSNRSDFIRTAIRNQLDRHQSDLQQSFVRHSTVLGVLAYGRRHLEAACARGERLKIHVVGLLSLGADVTPELARDAIESISVYGAFRAPHAVKAALADRVR